MMSCARRSFAIRQHMRSFATGLNASGSSKARGGGRGADLRSDTVTQPTAEMRQAMAAAPVGDDVFGDDPSVNDLESRAADVLGKEAALFVPSGTMGNLIALGVHTTGRGQEVICGDRSHIFLWEGGGQSVVWGNHARTLRNNDDGTIDVTAIAAAVREDDPHYPATALVCLENTHNYCGGRVLPNGYMEDVRALCNERYLGLHVDGARLFNAAVASGREPAQLLEHCDSASICLSKGLGAPVGSVLVGTATFVAKARRLRKLLGGGMRQSGILAAGGLIALTDPQHARANLVADHANAQVLAAAVEASPHLSLAGPVDTNIVYFDTVPSVGAAALAARLDENHGVRLLVVGPNSCRAVCNLMVDASAAADAAAAIATEAAAIATS